MALRNTGVASPSGTGTSNTTGAAIPVITKQQQTLRIIKSFLMVLSTLN